MKIQKIAAFSDAEVGGNPAGVSILNHFPDDKIMKKIAAEVGFSETVFAAPTAGGFRVRYFSPEMEVPFCGHATIALGAALAQAKGDGRFQLFLNEAEISVEASNSNGVISASLQSPATSSCSIADDVVSETMDLFGFLKTDLDSRILPALINAGANHFVFALRSRALLSEMNYQLELGRELMLRENLATIMLVYAETPQLFHARNPFASSGVYEDPATGAATAAFAGYLRDTDWPHNGSIDVVQGEDMGMRSLLKAEIDTIKGSPIKLSGTARLMQ